MLARKQVLSQVRYLFEQRRIDPALLVQLYMTYNPLAHIEDFIHQSQLLFPKLNCGIASLYLQYVCAEGTLTKGAYRQHPHTFLMFDKGIIADITADQFGGPRIYLGHLKSPWRFDF